MCQEQAQGPLKLTGFWSSLRFRPLPSELHLLHNFPQIDNPLRNVLPYHMWIITGPELCLFTPKSALNHNSDCAFRCGSVQIASPRCSHVMVTDGPPSITCLFQSSRPVLHDKPTMLPNRRCWSIRRSFPVCFQFIYPPLANSHSHLTQRSRITSPCIIFPYRCISPQLGALHFERVMHDIPPTLHLTLLLHGFEGLLEKDCTRGICVRSIELLGLVHSHQIRVGISQRDGGCPGVWERRILAPKIAFTGLFSPEGRAAALKQKEPQRGKSRWRP